MLSVQVTPFDRFEQSVSRFINARKVYPIPSMVSLGETDRSWYGRAKVTIKEWDQRLEDWMPNFMWQNRYDQFERSVHAKLEGLKRLNRLIDLPSDGPVVKQLLLFLVRLPLKVARNIIALLFDLLENIVKSSVHPLKAGLRLADFMVDLVKALTKPESLSKMGAGILGASAGHMLLGNPVSTIGLFIGAALLLAGYGWTFVEDFKNQVPIEMRLGRLGSIIEAFCTGLALGLIAGSIQKALRPQGYKFTNLEEAKEFADRFIEDNHLPNYTSLSLDNGKVILSWSGQEVLAELAKAEESIVTFDLFNPVRDGFFDMPLECQVIFSPGSSVPQHILKIAGIEEGFNMQGNLPAFAGYPMSPLNPAPITASVAGSGLQPFFKK